MALGRVVILRCLAKRGLEGRIASIQSIGRYLPSLGGYSHQYAIIFSQLLIQQQIASVNIFFVVQGPADTQ